MASSTPHTGLITPASTVVITADCHERLDKFISQRFPLYSRSFFATVIASKYVTINDKIAHKPSTTVKPLDVVSITFPDQSSDQDNSATEPVLMAMGIKVVYTHEHFLVLSKPAGITVHKPNAHSTELTLVDWLTHNFKEIRAVGAIDRPGIVHRLDKDTSGLIIVARTNYGQRIFGDMFKNRAIHKTYHALVTGHPPATGTIELPIGRHPVTRNKMTTFNTLQQLASNCPPTIRNATTHYRVIDYLKHHSLVEFKPVTGRTHQIRVHAAALGHALIGDKLYGKQSPHIKRHALHAHSLEFEFDGQPFSFTEIISDDLQHALQACKN